MTTTTTIISSPSSSQTTTLCVLSPAKPLVPPPFYRPRGSHPPHWKNANPLTASPRGFQSPWPSDNKELIGLIAFLKTRLFDWKEVPIQKPPSMRQATFIEEESSSGPGSADRTDGLLRYTWLGHAACHLQIPLPVTSPSSSSSSASSPVADSKDIPTLTPPPTLTRALNILTDPVFSQRSSPFQFMGPARYTPSPTSVAELAASDRAWPDVVLLSHNHYDHLDYSTMRLIASRPRGRELPIFVVPMGLTAWFHSNMKEVPAEKLVELDWWEERVIQARFHDGQQGRLRIVCTPAQHFSSRTPFDEGHTLWASYAIHVLPASSDEVDPPSSSSLSSSSSTPPLPRIWFSGDTGYRSVPREATRAQEDAFPHCPAFEEIGSLLGPFDLSLIACGAYNPRGFMSRVHVAPHEAVLIHQQIKSRKTFGIHHSTFRLTPEDVNEPASRLVEEARLAGLPDGEVGNLELGETRVVEVGKG